MPEHDEQPLGEHPQDHEHSDVSIRGLAIFFAIFVGFAILAHVLLYYVYWGFDATNQRQQTVQSAIQPPPTSQPIPLQGIPGLHAQSAAQDTRDYLDREQALLRGYGPTTRPGVGRIPIARAMDLVIERNLLKNRAAMQMNAEGQSP